MPELPEAETIVRVLGPRVVGSTVSAVDVVHADVLTSSPDDLRRALRGRTFKRVERRGKNIVLRLENGSVVVVNLGMTGRLFPLAPGEHPPSAATHPAVRFRFREGGTLLFDDVRRFGRVEVLRPGEWRRRSGSMGPEPLGRAFTASGFHAGLSASRSPVRTWLLDQRRIAGVGNIYANEALHRAGVHPARVASSLTDEEAGRLHGAIRTVLRQAIRAGGTTIRDFRGADGVRGAFVHQLTVYGKESEPCPRCTTSIRRIVFGGRSAFFCPRCQSALDGTRPV
jgi:formamidopyrimidine-DNA glycosylase